MTPRAPIQTHEAAIRGLRTRWLTAPGDGAPVLYVHGVPDEGSMWTGFLQRSGGIAPDLPGFGASQKPRHHPYGIASIADHLEGLLDHLQIDRFRLVVHDWGGAALALAQRMPERVERLVIIDALPLLPGYHWHRLARVWRTPIVGELFMALTGKHAVRFISREARVAPGPLPEAEIDRIWSAFDRGTRNAILRQYRSAPETQLAGYGDRLAELACPALVLWGDRDPYVPARFADAYGAALPNATVQHVADASHWCWIDRPDLIERVTDWLDSDPSATPIQQEITTA